MPVAVSIDLGPETDRACLSLLGTGIRTLSGIEAINIFVDGHPIVASYACPEPSYPGVDQINVLLLRALTGRGAVPIRTASQVPWANYNCTQPVCLITLRTLESAPVQLVFK